MADTDIDFRRIRSYDSSQNSGFEELCCQLYSLMLPEKNATWTRKSGAGGFGGMR